DGTDAALQQAVDEPRVERDPRRVHRARAAGLDARPGDRETVRLQPELGHQVEVRLPSVVVVVGYVTRVAVPHLAGRVAEGVPDRGSAAVLPCGTLDLVRGGGGADEEIGRELESAVRGVRGCGGHCSILPRSRVSIRRFAVSRPSRASSRTTPGRAGSARTRALPPR